MNEPINALTRRQKGSPATIKHKLSKRKAEKAYSVTNGISFNG
jgi:hypothetical protein